MPVSPSGAVRRSYRPVSSRPASRAAATMRVMPRRGFQRVELPGRVAPLGRPRLANGDELTGAPHRVDLQRIDREPLGEPRAREAVGVPAVRSRGHAPPAYRPDRGCGPGEAVPIPTTCGESSSPARSVALTLAAGTAGRAAECRALVGRSPDRGRRRLGAHGAERRGLPAGRSPHVGRVHDRDRIARGDRVGRRPRPARDDPRARPAPRHRGRASPGCARDPRCGGRGGPGAEAFARHRDGRAHARPAREPSPGPRSAGAPAHGSRDQGRGRLLARAGARPSGPTRSTPCARR